MLQILVTLEGLGAVKGCDGFRVLVSLQGCQGPRLKVHDTHRGVCVCDEQIRRETLVLADLGRVVQRVAQVSIAGAVAHVFDLPQLREARTSLVKVDSLRIVNCRVSHSSIARMICFHHFSFIC